MAAPHPGELGDLLADAYAQLEERVAVVLVDRGFGDIRSAHAPVFQTASVLEEPTITSMAAVAGITKQHMSQLVLELERLGYVARSRGPDARKWIVGLTERGGDAVRAAAEATAEVEATWLRSLGARQVNSLVSALRVISGTAE